MPAEGNQEISKETAWISVMNTLWPLRTAGNRRIITRQIHSISRFLSGAFLNILDVITINLGKLKAIEQFWLLCYFSECSSAMSMQLGPCVGQVLRCLCLSTWRFQSKWYLQQLWSIWQRVLQKQRVQTRGGNRSVISSPEITKPIT